MQSYHVVRTSFKDSIEVFQKDCHGIDNGSFLNATLTPQVARVTPTVPRSFDRENRADFLFRFRHF